jgi:hypothetical protein
MRRAAVLDLYPDDGGVAIDGHHCAREFKGFVRTGAFGFPHAADGGEPDHRFLERSLLIRRVRGEQLGEHVDARCAPRSFVLRDPDAYLIPVHGSGILAATSRARRAERDRRKIAKAPDLEVAVRSSQASAFRHINKKGITLRGRLRPQALGQLGAAAVPDRPGCLELDWLVTHWMRLDDIDEAIGVRTGGAGKVLLLPRARWRRSR